jgi:putative SOS response-associated peptidase YedK
MCNLYSITTNQEAMRQLFAVHADRAGNLPPMPSVFPDTMAPIVRTVAGGERELTMMRWGSRRRPMCHRAL